MGICAFRDKNVHFEAMDEKAARVEMVRNYVGRRQTPHIRVTQTVSGSSSDSEDILVEETLERPPAPPRPVTYDFAVQEGGPGARLSLVTMSLPMVQPTAKDHGQGLGALQLDTVTIPAILGTPGKSSPDEDVGDLSLFEYEGKAEEKASVLAVGEDVQIGESSLFESEDKAEVKASVLEVPAVGEDVVFEDFPETDQQLQAGEQVSDPLPNPVQVFALDNPFLQEEKSLSAEDSPPSVAREALPSPAEGTENADYLSQSSDATPTYHDVPTRTRESHFTEFESPGQFSAAQGLDEAAFVFLRLKSHYLRNPAPLLAPELLQRNTEGRLTIREEEAMRSSS